MNISLSISLDVVVTLSLWHAGKQLQIRYLLYLTLVRRDEIKVSGPLLNIHQAVYFYQ